MRTKQIEVLVPKCNNLVVEQWGDEPYMFTVTDPDDEHSIVLSLEAAREVLKAVEFLFNQQKEHDESVNYDVK